MNLWGVVFKWEELLISIDTERAFEPAYARSLWSRPIFKQT